MGPPRCGITGGQVIHNVLAEPNPSFPAEILHGLRVPEDRIWRPKKEWKTSSGWGVRWNLSAAISLTSTGVCFFYVTRDGYPIRKSRYPAYFTRFQRRRCEEIKRRCIRILQVKISEADAPLGTCPQGKPFFTELRYTLKNPSHLKNTI